MMAPVVRKTWAPRGSTPILYQPGRSHEKVSMAAAITLSPIRKRASLLFALYPNENVTSRQVITFLKDLLRHVRGPVILVWDLLPSHRSVSVQKFLRTRPRIRPESLPPYAPELNPTEQLWSYLKMNPLANFVPETTAVLAQRAGHHTRKIARHPWLLRSFIQATPFVQCMARA